MILVVIMVVLVHGANDAYLVMIASPVLLRVNLGQ